MTLPARAALLALALASLSACAKVQARTPAAAPALETPAPPPRMLVPAPPLEPIPEPPPTPAPAAASSSPPPRSSPPTRAPERVTPPPTPPTPPPQSDPPTAVLQTASNVGELEQKARELIGQALRNLAKVNFPSLGREPKEQFNLAKRYIDLAFDQIAIKNFVRALQLADNAAALALQLVK